MPVELVTAAVLATGYRGPISLEVFNEPLNRPGKLIPQDHAMRGISSLERLTEVVTALPPFWQSKLDAEKALSQVLLRLRKSTFRS